MGRDLYYTIPKFFEDALSKHSTVKAWQRIDHPTDDDNFLYLIKRHGNLSDVVVHASDAYFYTMTDYFQRPGSLTAGSFIYIARPEAGYDWGIVDLAKNDQISIGKFGAIIGALYHQDHWEYIPKERREEPV